MPESLAEFARRMDAIVLRTTGCLDETACLQIHVVTERPDWIQRFQMLSDPSDVHFFLFFLEYPSFVNPFFHFSFCLILCFVLGHVYSHDHRAEP